MMDCEPDREQLIIDQDRVPLNCDSWAVRPGGYLAGVGLAVESYDGWSPARSDGLVRVELTSCDQAVQHGRFLLEIGYGFHKGGILLPEPLPNLNAALPYMLRFLDKPPALRLFIVSCQTNTKGNMEYREQFWKETA